MRFKKAADKLYSKLIAEEVDGKIVYYRKRRVYPSVDSEGNINWFNFIVGGKWSNLLLVLLIVGITLGVIYEYNSNFKTCADMMSEYNLIKQATSNFSVSPQSETLRMAPNLSIVLKNNNFTIPNDK